MKKYQTAQTMGSDLSEYFEVHEKRFEILEETIKEIGLHKGDKVLDVGCFPPRIMEFGEDLGFEMYGVAYETEQVVGENIKVLDVVKEKLPWENHFFDLVIMTEVIEHIPYDPRLVLGEIRRVLKQGGMLILTTPNAARLQVIGELILGKPLGITLDQLKNTKPNDGSIYQRHNKEYIKAELEELLSEMGFKETEVHYSCFYPPTRRRVRNRNLWARVFNWLGYLPQLLVPRFKDSLFVQTRV